VIESADGSVAGIEVKLSASPTGQDFGGLALDLSQPVEPSGAAEDLGTCAAP
jgi:hypothetical protein